MAIISVTTAAEDRLLAVLSDVKADLGIQGQSEDAVLCSMIESVSAEIVSYTGREFAQERVVETVPGYGGVNLILSRLPIVTIHSVQSDGNTITDYDATLSHLDSGLLYRKDGWRWSAFQGRALAAFPIAREEEPLFAVDYTAGYGLPNWGTVPTPALPKDVERAAVEMIKGRYNTRSADGSGVVESVSTDGLTVRFGRGAGTGSGGGPLGANIPQQAIDLLAPYVRIH